MIGSVFDASHADEHCERTVDRFQGGRMKILATRGLADQTDCGFHSTAFVHRTR